MPSDATRIPDPAVRALTRQIAELTREVETLKRGQRTSQLGNSSLDDGTLWFTQGGVKRVSIGKQVDGKFGWGAVNGDPPPRPTPAILEAGTNGVTIGWDGQFVGNPPSDFVHVKAFLSPVGASFIPSDGNCVGHLLGRAKLPVSPLDQTGYWAILIAYNTSGVASEPSIVQGPVTPQPVVATEILDGIVTEVKLANDAVTAAKIATGAVGTAQLAGQSVDLSKLANGSVDATKIVDGSITPAKVTFTAQDIGSVATYNQTSQPSGTVPAGSLWFDGSKLRRYSGSGWVELTDAGIANALSAAQQAQTDAANALNTASGAQAAVAGKVTVYYQSTSPSGANTGDLWINTGNQNRLSRWSGSAWVAVEDQRIAAALVNAQTAQATADGKITAFYQATAPTTGMGVGDFWYKSDAGNLPHRWNGTTWVPLPAGSGAIADGAVTTGKIAGSAVDVSKLADGSVNAAKILNGAVVQDKIAANAVGANQIAANAITAGKIAANVVGANELAANSVIAGKIAADAVTATNIAAGSIQAQHIAAAQILAEKIASGAITTEKLAALSITADKMAANSVTAGSILAGAVTADKLEALLVLASTIIAGDPNDWHLELGDPVTPLLYWNNDSTGFAVSRDPVTGQSNAYLSGRIEFGNGSQIEQDYLDLCEQASTGFQTPKPRQSRTLIYSDPVTTPNPQPSWASATGRGSLLLLSINAINYASTGAPTLTVPSGWQLVRTQTYGSTGSARSSLYYVPNSGSSRTREAISASIASSWSVSLVEYSGIAATALDVSAGTTGSSSTASTGTTGAAAQNNELQVAFFHTLTAATPGKSGFGSPTGGFSTLTGSGGNRGQGGMVAARTTAAGGTASSTASTSGTWSAMVATFRTAAAAPVPSPPPSSVVRLFTRRMAGKSNLYTIDDAGQSYPVGRLPYARVKLTTSPTLAANTDVYAQGDWQATADLYGMVAVGSTNTFSNITIPVSGNWLIDYKTIYQTSSGASTNRSNIVAFVTKNGRNGTTDSIARDMRQYNGFGSDGSPVQATRVVPLVAGDQLFWANWSNATAQILSSALNVLTEMSVHYLGPNY